MKGWKCGARDRHGGFDYMPAAAGNFIGFASHHRAASPVPSDAADRLIHLPQLLPNSNR